MVNAMETSSRRDGTTVGGIERNKKRKFRESRSTSSHRGQVETNEIDTEQGIKKRKKKKTKHSEVMVSEDHGDEEAESALALMKLRNNGSYEGITRQENDSDLAGAQLLRESSLVPFEAHDVPEAHSGTTSSKDKSNRRKKGRRSTHKDVSEMDLPDEYPKDTSQVYETVSASKMNGKFSAKSKSQHVIPHSSLSLDDINSSDEEVAALLQEYENHMTPRKIPLATVSNDSGKSDPIPLPPLLQRPRDATHNHPNFDQSEVPQSSDQNIPGNSRSTRKKRSRKQRSRKHIQDKKEEQAHTTDDTGRGTYKAAEAEASRKLRRLQAKNHHLSPGSFQKGGHLPAQSGEMLPEARVSVGDEVEDSGLLVAESGRLNPPMNHRSSLPMELVEQPLVQVTKVSARTTSQLGKKRGPYKKAPKPQEEQKAMQMASNGSTVKKARTTAQPQGKDTKELDTSETEEPNDQYSVHEGRDDSGPLQPTSKAGPKRRNGQKRAGGSVNLAPGALQRPIRYNPSPEELANSKGPFTKGENEALHAYRLAYVQDHKITLDQFTEKIQANAHNSIPLKAFWSELCEVLPYRNRQSIQKFCRRQFHPFQKRGQWTPEEEEQLVQAVALKGKSWIAVGQICERLPEDCRDRYRNYHVNADKRNKDRWNEQEVDSLVKAVGECIYLIKADMRSAHAENSDLPDPDSEADLEKFINWQMVSDRMGGIRSRIQCSYKWKTLKLADQQEHNKAVRTAQRAVKTLEKFTDPKAPSSEGPSSETPATNWRLERAKDHVESNMLPGDKYYILQAILRSRAFSESDIPWKELGQGEEFRDRWSSHHCKAAWSIIKAEAEEGEEEEGIIRGGETGRGFMDRVTRISDQLVDREGDRLDDRWDPEETGGESAKDAKIRRRLKRERRARKQEKKSGKSSGLAHGGDAVVDPRLRELPGVQFFDSSESSSEDEIMEGDDGVDVDVDVDPALDDDDARLEANVRLLQSA